MAQQENQWQQALAAIDASSIDALNAIKKDHDILDERLKALDGVKQDFAEAVYTRVRGDYEKRRAVLDEQAAPLKDAARMQYAKLRELTQRIEADHEAIKLDQQELELRRKLGEFDEKEFKRRIGEIEGTIKERTQAHEQASALKKRFLEPFGDEAELTAMQDEAAAAAAQIIPPGTTQRQTLAGADLATIANTLAEMRTNEVAAVLDDAPPNKTQVMSAINLPEPALAAAAAAPAGATQVFRAARLVPQNPEAGKQSYALALKPTNIGTDAANEIRIVGPGVDAKHAQIAVSMGGFTIVDLNSKHGTRVNAEKVRERQLRHEDVVQIGAARFVFREG